VADNAVRSDLAIVLAGEVDDTRTQRGLDLLRTGYAREVVLDAPTFVLYGRHAFEYAQDYVQTLPPELRPHVHVCVFTGDSTKVELLGISQCAKAVAPKASKVLVVTSDFHTRRALSIAKRLFPEFSWSASAAHDPRFGIYWWRDREWAKTCFSEWQKLLWWQAVERWKS
jgi:hypothetical protein